MRFRFNVLGLLSVIVILLMITSTSVMLLHGPLNALRNDSVKSGSSDVSPEGFHPLNSFKQVNSSLPEVSYIFDFQTTSGDSYDSFNGLIYVSDGSSGKITVFNPANNTILGFIQGSQFYGYSFYDKNCNTLYVAGPGGTIMVLNPDTGNSQKTISGINGSESCTMVFDPAKNSLYVASRTSLKFFLFEINLSTDKIVLDLTLHNGYLFGIGSMAYDPQNQVLYVPLYNDTILALRTQNDHINGYYNATLDQPSKYKAIIPYSATYDPLTKTVFITSDYLQEILTGQGSTKRWDNISEFLPSSNKIIDVHQLGGDPYAPIFSAPSIWDNASHSILIANSASLRSYNPESGNISTIKNGFPPVELAVDTGNYAVYGTVYDTLFWASGNTLHYGSVSTPFNDPFDIVYDKFTHNMYLANGGSNYITVINGTTNSIIGTVKTISYIKELGVDNYNGELLAVPSSYSGTALISPENGTILHYFNQPLVVADSNNGAFFEANGTHITELSGSTFNTDYVSNFSGNIYSLIYDSPLNSVIFSYGGSVNNNYSGSIGIMNVTDHVSRILTGYNSSMASIAVNAKGTTLYWSDDSMFSGAVNLTTGKSIWNTNKTSGLVLYDPHKNLLFISGLDAPGANVAILNTSTGSIYFSLAIPFGQPAGLTYDPLNFGVYVTMGGYFGGFNGLVAFNYTPPPPIPPPILSKTYGLIFKLFQYGGITLIITGTALAGYYMVRKRKSA